MTSGLGGWPVHSKKSFATAVKVEHTRPNGARTYYDLSGASNGEMAKTLYLQLD